MDQQLLANFEFSTLILLAQTIIDFFYTTFRETRHVKDKLNLIGVLIFVLLLVFISWCVYFFDFGFRALNALLQEGGFTKNWANIITIAGYYLGYNFAKKLDKTKYGNVYKSDNYLNHLFVYTAIAVLTSIVFGIFTVWVNKNLFLK